MPIYRCSVFYETVNNEGWTENYYVNSSSLSTAQALLNTLVTHLVGLRANHTSVVDARVSDVTMRNNVLFTTLVVPIQGTYAIGGGVAPLEANCALMCRVIAALPRFARIFLRGLTSDVLAGRTYTGIAAWDALLRSFLNFLITNNFQARHRITPPPNATYSYSPLATIGDLIAGARKPGRPFGLLVGRKVKPGGA